MEALQKMTKVLDVKIPLDFKRKYSENVSPKFTGICRCVETLFQVNQKTPPKDIWRQTTMTFQCRYNFQLKFKPNNKFVYFRISMWKPKKIKSDITCSTRSCKIYRVCHQFYLHQVLLLQTNLFASLQFFCFQTYFLFFTPFFYFLH